MPDQSLMMSSASVHHRPNKLCPQKGGLYLCTCKPRKPTCVNCRLPAAVSSSMLSCPVYIRCKAPDDLKACMTLVVILKTPSQLKRKMR